MEIKKEIFAKIVGPMEIQGEEGVKVSLFVVSKKSPRLKKLNLEGLSPEERVKKLHSYGEEHRFVAVIQTGDQIYAHASMKFAEELKKNKELSIEGKKVSVKALTDDEYQSLNVVGDTFADFVLKNQISEKEEEVTEREPEPIEVSQYAKREYFATNHLLSDQIKIDYVIARMENIPRVVIRHALERMNEERRELDKRKEEDEKALRIKDTEIKRAILREEIKKEEVKKDELKKEVISEDVKRVKKTRGIRQ